MHVSQAAEETGEASLSADKKTVVPRPRRRRSKRGKLWLGILAVVAVLGVSAYFVYSALGKDGETTRYVTQTVSTGTLTVAVAGNGSMVSNDSAAVDPGVSGVVRDLDVQLGSQVKEGQVLFTIENDDLDASVQQSKAQYEQSQAQVLKARQSMEQAANAVDSSVAQAKAQYQQAQAQVARASQSRLQAKTELDSVKAAHASNPASVTATQVEIAQQNYNAAVSSYNAAVTNQKTAYAAYKQAGADAEADYQAAVISYNAALSSQKSASMTYAQAKETAAKRTVTAPTSGFVTTLSIRNGDQLSGTSGSARTTAASGASGTSTTPIVITDLSSLQAQVQISETDRPTVKVGQKVELSFDSLEDVTITGKVSEIDAVGSSSSGVVTYGVTIELDVQDARLKPAMTASASIITEVYTDVLLVPNSAVKTAASGGKYVQVLSGPNGTPQNVTIEVGAAGDSQTVVVSGLKAGDAVVTQSITPNSSSSSNSSGSQRGGFIMGGSGPGMRTEVRP